MVNKFEDSREITGEDLEVTGLTDCPKSLESEIPKTEAEGTWFTFDTNLHKDNCPKLSPEGINNFADNTTVLLHGYVDPTSGNVSVYTLDTGMVKDTDTQLIPLHGCIDPTSWSINFNKPVYNNRMTPSHAKSSMVCSDIQALGSTMNINKEFMAFTDNPNNV